MRTLRWAAGVAATIVLLAVAGVVVRNMRFDAAVGALKAGDYAAALKGFEPLANLGDSKAQYLVGQMYAFGWGVPKNDDAAIAWFRRAAMWSEGTRDPAAAAEYYVGRSYFEGIGVTKDDAEAAQWLKRSLEGGYPEAAKGYSKGPQQLASHIAEHYNYFRDYDPAIGKYVESDPIGLVGGANTFTYAGSNSLV